MRYPRPDPTNLLAWAQQLVTRLERDYYGRPVTGEVVLGAGATTEVSDGSVRDKVSQIFLNPMDATAAGAGAFVERANVFPGRFLISHAGGAGGTLRYAVL